MIDHETVILTRLWAILEARTAAGQFTELVAEANRIKLITAAGKVREPGVPPIKRNPADYPKVLISITGISDSLFTLSESYAMRAGATFTVSAQPIPVDLIFNVNILLMHDKSFALARQLAGEVMTAIRLAGPGIGITAFRVQRIGPVTQQNRFSDIENRGVASARPLDTSINLPILVRCQTTDLIT